MGVERLRFTGKDIEDEISKIGALITEHNDRKKEDEDIPILSSTMSGIYLQNIYFSKNTASENTLGYKKVPRGYFTYRSMSDTGAYTFNIQNLVDIGIVSPAYPVFRAKNIDANYFYYHLNNSNKFKSELLKSKQGGTRYALPVNLFKDLDVKIPPLVEQEKIGNFLSLFDRLIEKVETKVGLLKELKKGYLQQMFPAKGEKVPKIRFAGFDEEWENFEIGKLFRVTRGNVLAVSEVSTIKNQDNPYPVYSSQTNNNGLLGYYNSYLFDKAITWTTDGANAGTVKLRLDKFYSTNVNGVLLSDDGYVNNCVAEALNLVAWRYVSYVGNPKLMNNVMSKIKLLLPVKINEQEKIGNFFKALDSIIEKQEKEMNAIEQLKKGYMQRLFA